MYVAGCISCYLKLSSPSLSEKLKDSAYISHVRMQPGNSSLISRYFKGSDLKSIQQDSPKKESPHII